MTPSDEPRVRLLGRSLPVGDFRPWIRLLVMGGMLTAVAVAARSLSREIARGRLGERLAAWTEAEERALAIPLPLFEAAGAPGGTEGARPADGAEASPLFGRVVDSQRKPVSGAEVLAGPERTTTDADGRFVFPNHPPLGGWSLRAVPPRSRTELGPVRLTRTPASLPGTPTTVGSLRFPLSFDDPAALGARGDGLRGARNQESEDDTAPLVSVPGTLRSAAGLAIAPADAVVILESASGAGARRGSQEGAPPSPRVRLSAPAGEYRLWAWARGHLPLAIDLALPLPDGAPPLELELEPGADVEVRADVAVLSGEAPCALRIAASEGRSAVVALPADGRLLVRGLPAETLRFELLRSCTLARDPELPAAPLERCGDAVIRTLEPGRGNARVSLHAEPGLEREVHGTARPGSLVYREGARLEEPTSWTRADANGTFRLCAREGSRVVAADGAPPGFLPYAATAASSSVTLTEGVPFEIAVRANGAPEPAATALLRFTGGAALGRAELARGVSRDGRVRFAEVPPGVPFLLRLESPRGFAELTGTTPTIAETPPLEVELEREP